MDECRKMFMDFRKTIDKLCYPIMYRWAEDQRGFREIYYEKELVGFLMVLNGYVEALYVKPEYRRKGLARKAVLDYINEGGTITNFHIVNTNETAKKFWNSIFYLDRAPYDNPVDSRYYVQSLKEVKRND